MYAYIVANLLRRWCILVVPIKKYIYVEYDERGCHIELKILVCGSFLPYPLDGYTLKNNRIENEKGDRE